MRNCCLVSLLLWFSVSAVWGQAEPILPNSAQIQLGDNYFGQSLAISYDRNLLGPFWAECSIEMGSISLVSKAGQVFFLYTNNTTTNYSVSLNIHDILSAALSFHREEKGTLRWLNSLAVGISHFDLTANVSYDMGDSSDLYQGNKDISAFALYVDLHLLDFHPPKDNLYFSLGVKANTAFLPSPLTIDTMDSAGHEAYTSEVSENGGPIIFPDVELFLGIGRGFE